MTSSVIAALLLATLLLANSYVERITEQNSRALSLSNRIIGTLDRVSHQIRLTEIALHDLLADTPGASEDIIQRHLNLASSSINRLYGDHQLRGFHWFASVETLSHDINQLSIHLEQLLRKRENPGWVYPAMPLIAGTMLDANQEFEGQLTLALAEAGGQIGEPDQALLYRRLVHLRGLWRRMILDFRATMITFAGVSKRDQESEQQDVEGTYRLMLAALESLSTNRDDIPLGLETEDALRVMYKAARQWHREFDEVKKLRASNLWRGDIKFMETRIRPLQNRLVQDLRALEQQVIAWSGNNTTAADEAANHISRLLWVVSGLVLMIILLIYLALDRRVLRPVTQVAHALADEAEGSSDITLPQHPSREISMLVSAFEHMRAQIQGRQHALEHQALHDGLTGLPNRNLLQDRLEQGLKAANRDASQLGLLFLDLDRFKEVNDSLGHQIGDLMLQQVAGRLKKLLRDSDTVARLGGDEFAIILPQLGKKAAAELAERINSELDRPFNIMGNIIYVGVSIGIVVAPGDGGDVDSLIRRADSAMYRAKRANRPYAFYDRDHDQITARGLQLAHDLRAALRQDELMLYYQPRMDLLSGSITGAEALLRWQRGHNEWVSPELIVQAAERANITGELTSWVLNRALSDCASCRTGNIEHHVSVNLSARDFDDHTLPALISSALQRHQVPAHRLTLEITENAVLADPEHVRQILDQLAEMGVALSIDDFGTGFSSLAHLKLLQVHELKIDKSFVINMQHNDSDAVIVRSTIDLGHNLGLQVVAEGVENEVTLQQLRRWHCDLVQGYLVSRPVPLQEFVALVTPPNSALQP